ncbi:MAG: transcriptional regulator NrdR [Fusobacteriaceae bacterium]
MRCPFCGNDDTKVIDSRGFLDGNSIKRRRECPKCEKRFTTYEKVELSPLYVVKKSGGREKFDREKVLRGLSLATIKRDISRENLEELVMEIEKTIQNNLNNEICSNDLGDLILEKLIVLDEVAYVRFASVYKDFKDIKSFVELVEQLQKKRGENESFAN